MVYCWGKFCRLRSLYWSRVLLFSITFSFFCSLTFSSALFYFWSRFSHNFYFLTSSFPLCFSSIRMLTFLLVMISQSKFISFVSRNLYLLLKKKYWQHHVKVTYNLVETLRVDISATSETTNIPIRKKSIKAVKDLIVDLKKKRNKEKLDKRNLLRAHEDDENSLLYHFRKYNKNKNSADRNRYLAYKKLKHLNTKIRKRSDK